MFRSVAQTVTFQSYKLVFVLSEDRIVHEVRVQIPAPTKYGTPYGGRLEWIMPGRNKLVAHLKDSAKIRHKKRWSQVSQRKVTGCRQIVRHKVDTDSQFDVSRIRMKARL